MTLLCDDNTLNWNTSCTASRILCHSWRNCLSKLAANLVSAPGEEVTSGELDDADSMRRVRENRNMGSTLLRPNCTSPSDTVNVGRRFSLPRGPFLFVMILVIVLSSSTYNYLKLNRSMFIWCDYYPVPLATVLTGVQSLSVNFFPPTVSPFKFYYRCLLPSGPRVQSLFESISWLMFFPGFSLNCMITARKFGPHSSSVIIH